MGQMEEERRVKHDYNFVNETIRSCTISAIGVG